MDAKKTAAEIDDRLRALRQANAAGARAVRREYSRKFKNEGASFVFALVHSLIFKYRHRWFAYELIREHKEAFTGLDGRKLEALGRGIDSWWTVDAFARTLTGPAWLHGKISAGLVQKWARSKDLWWRRTALVSTVALNIRSHGGYGDAPRTLAICRLLVEDRSDMVVKAMSWALRALVEHDHAAVKMFLKKHDGVLAARVKREVMNKMTTGLKNPCKNV